MQCTTNNLKYTNTKDIKKLSEKNFKKYISENIYPGRGIVIGKNDSNSWILIYWIMGRSSNSRNRIFTHENGILSTESADPKLLEDPSLIIYNVMRDVDRRIVVSNGNLTDTICDGFKKGEIFTHLCIPKNMNQMRRITRRAFPE